MQVDHGRTGLVEKQDLIDALWHNARSVELLKLPVRQDTSGRPAPGSDTYGDVVR